jgi:hypothetical protein
MISMPFRARLVVAAASASGLAIALLSASGSAAAVGVTDARSTASSASAHWSRVTPGGTSNLADIGLARGSDGVLHVVWTTGSSGSQRIMDTPIGRTGAVGHPVTIARFYLATDPDATVTPRGLDAVWNGDQNSSGHPSGTFVATRPASGGAWRITAQVPPLPGISFTSSPDTATTGSDGKPLVAFTGTDSLAVDHLGHPEVELGPAKCCVYNAGLATDGHDGQTWISYLSLIPHHEGVFVRPLSASGKASAGAKLLPGSVTGGGVVELNQRVGITGRGKGRAGVYVTYLHGYPTAHGFDLARIGPAGPVRVTRFGGFREEVAAATVTADPHGRLWVGWFYGDGAAPALFVRRSNLAATSFGPVQRVALPRGTSTIWKVYLSAGSRDLDVLALITRRGNDKTTAYWSALVRPAR